MGWIPTFNKKNSLPYCFKQFSAVYLILLLLLLLIFSISSGKVSFRFEKDEEKKTKYRDVRVQILIWFQTFLLFTKPHFQTFNALKSTYMYFQAFQIISDFFRLSHRHSHIPANTSNSINSKGLNVSIISHWNHDLSVAWLLADIP